MENEQAGACWREARSGEVELARAMIDKDRQCVRAWEDRLAETFDQPAGLLRNSDYLLLISFEGRAILRELWDHSAKGKPMTQTELAKVRLQALRSRSSDARYRKVDQVVSAARRYNLVEEIPSALVETKRGNAKPLRATRKLDELVLSVARLEQHLMRAIVGASAEPSAANRAPQTTLEQREWKS